LAVTLVTRDDTRLVADIEKLIKKKIELEPFELEDDRPRRPRPRADEDREERITAPQRSSYERRPMTAQADPFFDRPYEATAAAAPGWEAAPKAAPATTRGMSSNIKPKRKVAALLGGVKA
jgi:hypothetical protein